MAFPQCPRGCDPAFLSYTMWRGSSVRIVQCEKLKGKYWYSGLLRCNDCGEGEVYFSRITAKEKKELDKLIESGREEMEALKDQYDQEHLERFTAFEAYVKERDARAEQQADSPRPPRGR